MCPKKDFFHSLHIRILVAVSESLIDIAPDNRTTDDSRKVSVYFSGFIFVNQSVKRYTADNKFVRNFPDGATPVSPDNLECCHQIQDNQNPRYIAFTFGG